MIKQFIKIYIDTQLCNMVKTHSGYKKTMSVYTRTGDTHTHKKKCKGHEESKGGVIGEPRS